MRGYIPVLCVILIVALVAVLFRRQPRLKPGCQPAQPCNCPLMAQYFLPTFSQQLSTPSVPPVPPVPAVSVPSFKPVPLSTVEQDPYTQHLHCGGKPYPVIHTWKNDLISTLIQSRGLFETTNIHIFAKMHTPFKNVTTGPMQPLFLDIGSNVGVYTVCAARLGLHVTALEAMPPTAAKVAHTIADNKFQDRVNVFNVAITSRTGGDLCIASNFVSKENMGGVRVSSANEEEQKEKNCDISVPQVSIDDVVQSIPNITQRRIVGFKMDVEGWESEALAGAEKTLGNHDHAPCYGLIEVQHIKFLVNIKRPKHHSYAINKLIEYGWIVVEGTAFLKVMQQYPSLGNMRDLDLSNMRKAWDEFKGGLDYNKMAEEALKAISAKNGMPTFWVLREDFVDCLYRHANAIWRS
eukprot:TRINITY_DN68226_c0_g1_i1.p1 TRINITY_DN68226_c0_g1~~TRINITY_DN68226_c0_g1_i1.p1  ORF type:complete len:408 (-),score=16.01 TRINITY_DN68226_c0_g1_i1:176-1399(-)